VWHRTALNVSTKGVDGRFGESALGGRNAHLLTGLALGQAGRDRGQLWSMHNEYRYRTTARQAQFTLDTDLVHRWNLKEPEPELYKRYKRQPSWFMHQSAPRLDLFEPSMAINRVAETICVW
jgi:hypothetical protein